MKFKLSLLLGALLFISVHGIPSPQNIQTPVQTEETEQKTNLNIGERKVGIQNEEEHLYNLYQSAIKNRKSKEASKNPSLQNKQQDNNAHILEKKVVNTPVADQIYNTSASSITTKVPSKPEIINSGTSTKKPNVRHFLSEESVQKLQRSMKRNVITTDADQDTKNIPQENNREYTSEKTIVDQTQGSNFSVGEPNNGIISNACVDQCKREVDRATMECNTRHDKIVADLISKFELEKLLFDKQKKEDIDKNVKRQLSIAERSFKADMNKLLTTERNKFKQERDTLNKNIQRLEANHLKNVKNLNKEIDMLRFELGKNELSR